MADELAEHGYRVDVTPPSLALLAAESIGNEYRQDPSAGPLVVIGHSIGGRLCCTIPWRWREAHIPVKLVVILDANPMTPVCDNVERCVNLYVTNKLGVFHGQDVWSVDPDADLVNLDMTKVARPAGVPGVDHFNIDDSAWIHELVIEEVDRAMGQAARRLVPDPAARPRVWGQQVESNEPQAYTARHGQPARRANPSPWAPAAVRLP